MNIFEIKDCIEVGKALTDARLSLSIVYGGHLGKHKERFDKLVTEIESLSKAINEFVSHESLEMSYLLCLGQEQKAENDKLFNCEEDEEENDDEHE